MSILKILQHITICATMHSPLRGALDLLHPLFSSRHERIPEATTFAHKPTTVLLYIAGRNDLDRFVRYNLGQLESIGTNSNITFLVDLHTTQKGKQERSLSQRFIVHKNRLVQVGNDREEDSGNPETLVSACAWAFTHFPSDVKVLILWNHGTGALEPNYRVAINPSEFYTFNPQSNLIELNRTIGFLDYLELCGTTAYRGICFDNATKHYLTNHDIGQALRNVCNTYLNGQPLDIISCDACLMAGIEPLYSLKPQGQPAVAKYFVGSQEVVLATGYPYAALFSATATTPQTGQQLARHFVTKYAQAYHQITQDYTQSVVDLNTLDPLYSAIEHVAEILTEGMHSESHGSVRTFITTCSSKERCTHFEEPTYKDMCHLFENMRSLVGTIYLTDNSETRAYREKLSTALTTLLSALKQTIIAHASGKNLARATGLSIYLPPHHMHLSYPHTDFGRSSSWTVMLRAYLNK